eukprot:m.797326 g.797326  ORF g.797326 m.797326 type:complete len:77 (-) comp59254_c0_seq15:2382-2612(-)
MASPTGRCSSSRAWPSPTVAELHTKKQTFIEANIDQSTPGSDKATPIVPVRASDVRCVIERRDDCIHKQPAHWRLG